MTHLYLASTSPARLATLRSSGIEPKVIPSHVDEDALVARVEAERGHQLSPSELVLLLAQAKAEAVIGKQVDGAPINGLIVGGDSAFVVDDEIYGKPHTPEKAHERWQLQRGHTGTLYSGHWVIDHRNDSVGASVGEVRTAEVTFSNDISDAELAAYIETGEPLQVAGAFTIDSLGAAFIERIDGDPSTVVGISVPTLRRLVTQLGIFWPDLWNKPL